jgi:hypothetical protein
VAAAAAAPLPPAGERNKLVEQYMMLQQQRTSAFSGMPRPTAVPAAAAPVAAAAPEAASGGDGEEDLEALQREFESQFSHVFAPPPGAAGAAPSVVPPPRMPAAVTTVAAAPPMPAASMVPPPAEARAAAAAAAPFSAAGGFLQPDISQIPMPPAPVASKKLRAVDGLPPSTKKWNDRRGEKTEQQELLQRLTSELLSQAVPAGPPIVRKMPPQAPRHRCHDATVSINVDHLRMMLEALKDKEK